MRTIAGLVFTLAAVATHAAPLHIQATGTLHDTFRPSLPDGTPWSIDWIIDTDMTDTDPTSVGGQYSGLTGTAALGPHLIYSESGDLGGVQIANFDHSSAPTNGDYFQATMVTDQSNLPSIDGASVLLVLLNCGANPDSPDLYSSDALTGIIGLVRPNCTRGGAYTELEILFHIGTSRYFGRGYIDTMSNTVVPVPAAVWLLGSALGVLGWLKRRVS